DVKPLTRIRHVGGSKSTAGKTVTGNYRRAASHFKSSHEFAIYTGNAHLIFDLFAPPESIAGGMRHYWNRYLTQRARPYGVVAGPANVMPREWQRSWQGCRSADFELMHIYERVLDDFRSASTFKRGGRPYEPTIACFKAALKQLGVITSEIVAPGTPALTNPELREFVERFSRIRENRAAVLE